MLTRVVKVTGVDEPWTTVTLADGSTIRIKLVVTEVRAVIDQSGAYAAGPDGGPQYQFDTTMVTKLQTQGGAGDETQRTGGERLGRN